LEFPELLSALTGAEFPACVARLPNFGRYLVRGELFPAVVAEPGASTIGTLYSHLSPAHLRRLDDYEGPLYRRCPVRVYDDRQRGRVAWTYVIAPRQRRCLGNESWDKEGFARYHLASYLKGLRG
jgi:hypothetical protein